MRVAGGQTTVRANLGQNSNGAVPAAASASPFTIPPCAEVVEVTGAVQINNIVSGRLGRRVTLVFTNATPAGISAGVTGARLASAFAPAQNGSITLVCGPGGTWYEAGRTP